MTRRELRTGELEYRPPSAGRQTDVLAPNGGPATESPKGLGRLIRERLRPAEQPPSTCEGRVTGVSGDAITGWAWDSAKPYEPIEIEIYAGSREVGRARADLFDLELAKAKLGNGMHRFEARLDRLPPGAPPFQLRIAIAGTEVELAPSITLTTLEEAERLLSGCEYLGRITGIENGMICGWAMNRRNPHEQPLLTLRDGQKTILTQPAREGTSAAIEGGVIASAYKFELPLPSGLLDGNLHQLSVSIGDGRRDIEGSPILFGPSDFASLNRSLVSAFERLQRLDRRVEALQGPADRALFEKQLTTRILDRIDMLLNIHRDSIEREMAVMRRQLTHLLSRAPESDPDLIPPLPDAARIDDEIVPPSVSFSVTGRAAPTLVLDVSARTATVTPKGAIKWGHADDAGLCIAGSGGIDLDDAVVAPASLVLSGQGAQNPLEFCGVVAALDGYPLSGRVDVMDDTRWSFIATTIGGALPGPTERGLAVRFLPGPDPRNPLTLKKIAVFGHGRVPQSVEADRPKTSIVYLGSDPISRGWYAVEASGRGGVCWMGARSETPFRVRPGRSYSFVIPEIRPLTPDILQTMQVSVAGVSASYEVTRFRNDASAFSVRGECTLSGEMDDDLVFEISFPREFVRSPMEIGVNDDERPLTIAVRAIALTAAD